jgi:thiamine biosynthesis lipoprotein
LEVSKLTNGAFDIVEQPLANVKAYSTYKNLEVRLEPPSLKKSDIALSINVSAIAKGYAVDSVARLLDEFKFEHYLVEVGSEVRCKGSKSKEEKWIIGIEAPLPVTAEQFPGLQKELPFPALSMATSSDNKTASLLGSVSVFDTDCVRADALAAAMSVLGEQKGLELAEKHGLAVLYLLRSENQDQTIREASSVKFKKLFP